MEFGINFVPTRRTIYTIHRKFMKTGSVVDAQRSRRPRSVRSKEKDSVLKRGIRIESRKIHTVYLAAVELEISRSSIQRMLRKDIKAFPFKLQTVHKLEEEDNDRLCKTLLNHYRYKNNSSILDNIWINDETVFHLSGRGNRHNTRIWEQKFLR